MGIFPMRRNLGPVRRVDWLAPFLRNISPCFALRRSYPQFDDVSFKIHGTRRDRPASSLEEKCFFQSVPF